MPDRTQGGACLFGPKQHAVMFGLLAREICRHFGPDADALLLRAVETYGEERGRRMAERCRQNGVCKNTQPAGPYCLQCFHCLLGDTLKTLGKGFCEKCRCVYAQTCNSSLRSHP